MQANLRLAYKAGVDIISGTDAGNPLTLHGPSMFTVSIITIINWKFASPLPTPPPPTLTPRRVREKAPTAATAHYEWEWVGGVSPNLGLKLEISGLLFWKKKKKQTPSSYKQIFGLNLLYSILS